MGFCIDGNALIFRRLGETLRIEPHGRDALRVRASMRSEFTCENRALTEKPEAVSPEIKLFTQTKNDGCDCEGSPAASITNGALSAVVNFAGVISFFKHGKLILREQYRSYGGSIGGRSRCLKTVSREWKGVIGGDNYRLTLRFEPNEGERIYGMGQYQDGKLNLKGCALELCQRNSQISVPFYVSSLGYGFLWNNPGVGSVTFAENLTLWTSRSLRDMDYWICAGDTPGDILALYTGATGRAPDFPEDLLGLWQCKLRYRTQEEVLSVARRYRQLGITPSQIIIDFFHWTVQGDWKFDPLYWPDPKAMTDELHAMGIKVMVSVWPSVDRKSENFYPMLERGLLMRTERGAAQTYDYQGDCVQIDPFNPETRRYVWDVCKRSYADIGIDGFWLDNSEPDLGVYDFENFRYCAGPAEEVSNLYPLMYARTFCDNMKGSFVNLERCAWAGSQKYPVVIWSGDVPSGFTAFKDQLAAGLNMGLAGIPWWTTDIGGFMTDDVNDPAFRQLLLRWFQFAVFSPVLRMHGARGPYDTPALDNRDWGGGYLYTGYPNEMWSYGEECFKIMRAYYELRLELKPYIQSLYREASQNGSPLMRAMFYEFPKDERCWELDDQYMFGSRYLVAPVFELNRYYRYVYLPAGSWRLTSTGELFAGPATVNVQAPIEYMPVFERLGV